jgi:glycosyltransferase involved in cell wall biosynthesis
VLTEAMASGLAVAAFNYAAALEFVQNEDTGLVVPPGDSDALTSAAMRLISDPGLRQHLRDAAAARMAMQSWEIVISRFEAELERIATGAQTPPCLLREPWAQVT